MNHINFRIYYSPMDTDVYIAKDSENFENLETPDDKGYYEDFSVSFEAIPGITKLMLINNSGTFEEAFGWNFTTGDKISMVGDGENLNICVITIPAEADMDTTLYIDNGGRRYGTDENSRTLYFKTEAKRFPFDINMFSLEVI